MIHLPNDMFNRNPKTYFHRNINNDTTRRLKGKDATSVVHGALDLSLGDFLGFRANGPSDMSWETKESRLCKRGNFNDHRFRAKRYSLLDPLQKLSSVLNTLHTVPWTRKSSTTMIGRFLRLVGLRLQHVVAGRFDQFCCFTVNERDDDFSWIGSSGTVLEISWNRALHK
jgi:hypothetical protein